MTQFITYALVSLLDETLYIGHTSDIERRLREHNAGKTTSNRFKRPFKVLYKKSFQNRKEAIDFEKYLKSGSGREFLKGLK